MATTLAGRQSTKSQFNRGNQFISETYASSQDTFLPGNESILLSRGIVIEADFNRNVYGIGGVMRPPYSLNIKIIGDDFNTDTPNNPEEQRWYAPFFPIHNIMIPEIGEEVLVINESQDYSSKGYWIGRVNESPITNLFLAESWKGSSGISNEEDNYSSTQEKYGFSFDVDELRNNNKINKISPSSEFENMAVNATYGDVIQQGRSRTYIRHSFNSNNYTGILEQGLNNALNTTNDNVGFQPDVGSDPSIGDTRTKTIHLYDTSVKRLGDFTFASESDEQKSGKLNGESRSMIFNEADQIFNVAGGNNGFNTTLYSQVLGERLNSWHRNNINIMQAMLDGMTGVTTTVQALLEAFIDHEHAIPKIELDLEKTVTAQDTYFVPARYRQQPPQIINVPSRTTRVLVSAGTASSGPVYSNVDIPGFTREVQRPPIQVSRPRRRVRNREQTINFEAIIGGAENPRFTAPIELSKTPSTPDLPANASPQEIAMINAQGRGSSQYTDIGIKTNNIDNNVENLIDAFNEQKEQLNMIFNRVSEYLSENQFVN